MQPKTKDMVMATPASGQYEDQSASQSRPSSSPIEWPDFRSSHFALFELLYQTEQLGRSGKAG
jgi:hypothetical protein